MGRFLVDQMCGSLARYLRFCGHDAAYAPELGIETDTALRTRARRDNRILITRDQSLASSVEQSILLTALDIEGQLAEVADAGISLDLPAEPTRCGRCNGHLVRRADSESDPAYVPTEIEVPTYACERCGQVFWRGSHWDRVERTIEQAIRQ